MTPSLRLKQCFIWIIWGTTVKAPTFSEYNLRVPLKNCQKILLNLVAEPVNDFLQAVTTTAYALRPYF